jgi:hypothetical protein
MSVAVTTHSSEVEDVLTYASLSSRCLSPRMRSVFLPLPQLPRGEYVQVGKLLSWNKEIEGHRRRKVDEDDGRKEWSVSAEEAWGRGWSVGEEESWRSSLFVVTYAVRLWPF